LKQRFYACLAPETSMVRRARKIAANKKKYHDLIEKCHDLVRSRPL